MFFHKIDKWTAVAIVVANMVGTGVFTSLGFQLLNIENAWSIVMLWVLGGILALSGALSYAEIGSFLIKNGGEYYYLGQLYHPSIGFVAGFISIIVGFAAPIAAACTAFGKYFLYAYFSEHSEHLETFIALNILIVLSSIHLFSIKIGAKFQRWITLLKVLVILLFAIAFFYPNVNVHYFNWNVRNIVSDVFSADFAVSLIYVSYAYSGWNAAAYISGEIENPKRNLPKALVIGTLVVMILYVLLNMSFMYSAPVQALKGNVEVGVISAQYIFGKIYGNFIGFLISFLLISTINSMLMASPRVLARIGEDNVVLSVLNKRNKFDSPYLSVLIITMLSAVLIITSSFQWLINFIGITLIVFNILTAFGIFILRKQKNYNPVFKVPLYPFTPLFFILMNVWILVYVSVHQYSAMFISCSMILMGFGVYWLITRRRQ